MVFLLTFYSGKDQLGSYREALSRRNVGQVSTSSLLLGIFNSSVGLFAFGSLLIFPLHAILSIYHAIC